MESLMQELKREKEVLARMDLNNPDTLEQSRKVDKLVLQAMKALNHTWRAIKEVDDSAKNNAGNR